MRLRKSLRNESLKKKQIEEIKISKRKTVRMLEDQLRACSIQMTEFHMEQRKKGEIMKG